jgi:hypothetical protein
VEGVKKIWFRREVSKFLLPPFSLQRGARAISIVAGAHAAAGLGVSIEPCLEVNQSTVQLGRTSRIAWANSYTQPFAAPRTSLTLSLL